MWSMEKTPILRQGNLGCQNYNINNDTYLISLNAFSFITRPGWIFNSWQTDPFIPVSEHQLLFKKLSHFGVFFLTLNQYPPNMTILQESPQLYLCPEQAPPCSSLPPCYSTTSNVRASKPRSRQEFLLCFFGVCFYFHLSYFFCLDSS